MKRNRLRAIVLIPNVRGFILEIILLFPFPSWNRCGVKLLHTVYKRIIYIYYIYVQQKHVVYLDEVKSNFLTHVCLYICRLHQRVILCVRKNVASWTLDEINVVHQPLYKICLIKSATHRPTLKR